MFKVIVAKEMGMSHEEFDTLDIAVKTAEAHTQDDDVIRIGIFYENFLIAIWIQGYPLEPEAKWHIRDFGFREGDPASIDSRMF